MMLYLRPLGRTQLATKSFNAAGPRGLVALRGLSLKHGIQSACRRFATTASRLGTQASSGPPLRKFAYPENLCIYHAGVARTTFLACLKLSTLFTFTFFGLVVTPAYLNKEGLSPTAARTALAAVVPLVFVAYVTSPFVSHIHLWLPPFARVSEEALRAYVGALPPRAALDITTMSAVAKPRLSRVAVADLRPARARLGLVNFARDTAAANAARKWYMFRAVGRFGIQRNAAARAPWVWDVIAEGIVRRHA